MRQHRRPPSPNHRGTQRFALLVATGGLVVISACGSDDTNDGTTSAAPEATEETQTSEATDDGASSTVQAPSPTAATGTATVEINGVTHQYALTDPSRTACVELGGSLQVLMPEIGDDGVPIPDTELNVYLLSPGADPALHSLPLIEVDLADGTSWGAGDALIGGEMPPLELMADGRTANGTVKVGLGGDPATVIEAELEIAC